MALQTILIAADGTQKTLDLDAEARLALGPDEKLIIPQGLKRKKELNDSEVDHGQQTEEVVLVDESGEVYTVFLPEGAEVLVAQAQNPAQAPAPNPAPNYENFPTNPSGPGGSARPVETIPVNPNASSGGGGGGGGFAPGDYGWAIAGGVGGVGLIAIAASDSGGGGGGGGGTPPPAGNSAPFFGSDVRSVSVAENSTVVATVVASDADDDTLTYSIVGGADALRFGIDSGTGALTFLAAPDFEMPADNGSDNIYNVIVQASDGELNDTQALVITVTDINEGQPNRAPEIISGDGDTATGSVNEGATFITTVVASDPDGDDVAFSLTGPDASLFTITSAGVLTLGPQDSEDPADADGNNTYVVTILASDGELTDSQVLTVTVTNQDEDNTVIGGVLSGSVTETTSTDPGVPTATGQMSATDPDGPDDMFVVSNGTAQFGTFSVSAGGLWTYNLDSSDPAVSVLNTGQSLADSFTVTAIDGTTATVSIVVNGQDGVIDPTPNSTVGGDLIGAVVEAGSDNNNGTPTDSGQLTADNPDGPDNVFRPVSGGTATYGSFSVSSAGIWTYTLDNDNATVNGVAEGDTLSDSFTVTSLDGSVGTVDVTITGANDDPAVDAAQVVTTVEDMPLTITVEGMDVDGDDLTYTAGPREEGGQLTGGADGVFTYTPAADFVGRDSFVVTVSDGNGGTAEQTVSIDVTEANDDAPVIVSDGGGDEGSIQIIENTVAVTTVEAEDEDTGAVITYSITGGSEETFFRIDEDTGVLEFWAPPSAEQGQGQGLLGNRYEVIVTATDDTGLTDSQTLLVDVQNDGLLNEIGELPPRITSGGGLDETQVEINENNTLAALLAGNGGQLVNLDGMNDTLIFRIAGGDDAELFRIDQLASEPNTGLANLSFITAPDFEMPASANGDNEYDLIVQLSDDDGVDFQRITITVLDVDTVFVVDDVNDLLEAGGINNDRDVETASGNVLTNDRDEADAPIRVASANAEGGGPLIDVAPQGNTIQGEFGTLVLNPDGSYVYTPDQALIDAADANPLVAGIQGLNDGGSLTDTFIYTATNTDNVDGVRVPAELVITINGTNDAPVVDLNGPGPNGIDFMPNAFVEEGGPILVVSSNATVADVDNTQLVSATITLTRADGSRPDALTETLAVTGPTAVLGDEIEAAYNRDTGVLTLTGFDASPANFEAVLRTLSYNNTGDNVLTGDTRTVTVVVNDGQDDSEVAVITIPLIGAPDAPVAMNDTNLATADQMADLLIEAGGVNNATSNAGDATASGNVLDNDIDPDTSDNSGLQVVKIESGTASGAAANDGVVNGPALVGTYGSLFMESDGTWTYTLDNSDPDTQALTTGQVVTETFTYTVGDADTGAVPDTAGDDADADTATLVLTITGRNDAPTADLNGINVQGTGFEATYLEPEDGMAAMPVNIGAATALRVFDVDDTQLLSATLTLRGPSGQTPDAEVERLIVTEGFTLPGGLIFAYNPDTGIATLTGTATLGAYQSALRNIQYVNDGDSAVPGPTRTVSVTVNDGEVTGPASVSTITLIGADNAPVANADSNLAINQPVVEQGVGTMANPNAAVAGIPVAMGNVLDNDTDTDTAVADLVVTDIRTAPVGGGGAVVGLVDGVALIGTYGSLSIDSDGEWTYTLNNNDPDTQLLDQDQVVVDRFRYTVEDPEGNTGSALLSISITGTNDAPVAVANTRAVNENGANLTGGGPGTVNNLLTNDTDPDFSASETPMLTVSQVAGDEANVGAVVQGTYGTLVVNANGSYTYTQTPALVNPLNAGQVVQDIFSYTVVDEFGAESNTANLTITITGVADPTQFAAATRTVNVNENQTTVTTVMAMDADDEPLTYTITGGADQGFFNLDPMTGVLTFIAPRDFEMPQDAGMNNGYVVQVTATDASDGGTAVQTITVNVQDVNEAPTRVNLLLDQGVDIGEELDYQFPDIDEDDPIFADEDAGDVLTYTAALAGGGALPDFLDFDAATRTFTGTPTQAEGDMMFDIVVTATDSGGLTATDTFRISVGANNPPTVAMPLVDQMATENQAFSYQFDANSFADVDIGDQPNLVYTATLADGSPRPAWLLFDPSTRTFGGTPGPGDVQDLMIRVIATDPGGLSISDVFNLTVANVNDPVMAVDDTNMVTEMGVTEPGVSMAIGQAGLDGVLDNDEDPDLANDPDPDVLIVNRVMPAGGGNTPVPAGGNVTVMGTFGSLMIESDGSYTYTLDNGDDDTQALAQNTTADDVFTYRVSDGNGSQDTATLTITVSGANDAPVAVNDNYNESINDNPLSESGFDIGVGAASGVLANDMDPDTDDERTVNSVSFNGVAGTVGQPITGLYGDFTLLADGSYSYVSNGGGESLNAGEMASEVFTYTAIDESDAVSNEATLTFEIEGQNDAPVVMGLTTATNSFSFTATDVDSEAELEVLYTGSSLTLPTLANDGNPTTQMVAAQATPTNAIYRVSDDTVETNVARLILGTQTATAMGAAFDDTLTAVGSTVSALMYGFGGQDSLTGSAFNDILYGNAGNDRLRGQNGDDYLHGGAGDNDLGGGPGSDTIDLSAGGMDTIAYGANSLDGGGTDTVIGFNGNGNLSTGDHFDLTALLDTLPGTNIEDFGIVDIGGGNFELRVNTDADNDLDYLLAMVTVAPGGTFTNNDVIFT